GGALLDVCPDSPDDRNPLASVRNIAQLMRMRTSNDPELLWCYGHTLQVVVPDEPLLVRGDATRRAQEVTNLLTNAIKYEQRDGHISEVALGEGSVFTASLPLAVHEQTPASGPASEPAVAANEVAEQPRCILVVDDNVDVAESMSMLLRFRGHDVFVAHNGVNALQLAEQVSPAVVLLDIGLPDLDGYEVCRRLRRSGLEKARIIAMTGYGLERDRQRAEAAGFDMHCVKPVAYADLVKLLFA
ncbi:MAG: response regulator, partial [Gemmatimonadaceae bacterium]|nr:response regulator [Gemmatimonadaceae bacterium]